MQIATKKKGKISYYLIIGLVALLAVVAGFYTTYITPSLKGQFKAPAIIHIHGAFAFGWILLFLLQAILIKLRNFSLHRSFGYLAIFMALGIVTTLPSAGLFQVEKERLQGAGDTAISNMVGIVTTGFMFTALVATGYAYRRKPKIHKRLLLLATIVLLWPAWFRFRHYFPSVTRPDIWFAVVLADSLILLSWAADKITYGKIHPVLLYVGLFIMAEHVFEVLMFDSEPWRFWAKSIYAVFA